MAEGVGGNPEEQHGVVSGVEEHLPEDEGAEQRGALRDRVELGGGEHALHAARPLEQAQCERGKHREDLTDKICCNKSFDFF